MANQEIVFEHNIAASGIAETTGPFKYLMNSVKGLLKNIAGITRNKKKLIFIAIITIIWVVLSILPDLGLTGMPLRALTFLTLAGSSVEQGVSGMVGTSIGKGIFAYFLTSFVTSSGSFKRVGGGVKSFFRSFNIKEIKSATPLLAGAGVAFVAYNFLAGSATLTNSMMGITGLFLSLRALSGKAGFLKGFLNSFFHKTSKEKQIKVPTNLMISGMAAGFALSIPLSAFRIRFLCYFVGLFFLFSSFVIKIVTLKGKGGEQT